MELALVNITESSCQNSYYEILPVDPDPDVLEISPAFIVVNDTQYRSIQLGVFTDNLTELAYGVHTVEVREIDSNTNKVAITKVELTVVPCISIPSGVQPNITNVEYKISYPAIEIAQIAALNATCTNSYYEVTPNVTSLGPAFTVTNDTSARTFGLNLQTESE